MKLYRILTENKNYQGIIAQLQLRGIDATIIQSNGLWQGKAEKSIVIEILRWPNNNHDTSNIESFIYWLKKHNKQDKILLQTINLENAELI